MKLLRTIRLDPSDTFVFERAAEPGEWAVSGAFAFWDADPARLEGKARSAFRAGFLGVHSLGRSTLVQIVEAARTTARPPSTPLRKRLVGEFGAPDLAARGGGRRGGRVCGFALRSSERHADRRASHVRGRRVRETFRTLRPRGEREAAARLLVPRRRGRGGAGRSRRSGGAREGAAMMTISGSPAGIICSTATRAAG